MALRLKIEQRLQAEGLVDLFVEHRGVWTLMAKAAYDFVKSNYPENAIIRRDDVSDNLLPPVEVHGLLREFLAEARLREQYWPRHFCDLILDRVWDELVEEGD